MGKDHVAGYVYFLGSKLATFILNATKICVNLEIRELKCTYTLFLKNAM